MANSDVFCSTVIPTIGRASLGRTVESVLNQVCDRSFEVIVVNDSGRALPAANWQQAPGVQVIDTQRRERSVARNVGAAVARGRYLNFLDDDDWLLPGAFGVFARLADQSSAAWLYGASQLTDANGHCLFQFDHQISGNCFTQVAAGEWVPLQASLISTRVFFEVGGFNNNYYSVQDKDLLMRIALRFELAGTRTPVTGILRGIWDSSTDPVATTQNWQDARENLLQQPGVPARFRASAGNAYWHGRWLRFYLISAGWNAWHGQLITLAGRLFHATGAFLSAGERLFSASFWRALTQTHMTAGFEPTTAAIEPAAQSLGSRPTG